MLELPATESVRREDLERSSSQPEALIQGDGALELQAKLDATFGPTLTSITTLSPPGVTGATTTNEPTNDGQYTFRLFANPSSKPLANESEVIKVLQPAPRIDIHTPTPEPENLGFTIPFRPRSFYIREDISAETRRQYEIAAVTGEVVQKWSRLPCPGRSLPWRMSTLRNIIQGEPTMHLTSAETAGPSRKRRAKKKRRIAHRKKLAKGLEDNKREVEAISEKARAHLEKRKKKNYENRVRRKAKAKEKADNARAIGESDVKMGGD